ncbi:MAG: FoF1 ATP synthase subunit a [bacterium]
MSFEIFKYCEIKPLEACGFTNKFWVIHLDTLIYTWVAMLCLLGLSLLGRYFIRRDLNIVSVAYEKVVSLLLDTFGESFKVFNLDYFAFISCVFLFTLFACIVSIIPYMDEATKDLNTTLAIGLMSFLYVQYQKIKVHGVLGYLKEFVEPVFVLFPIHVVGELAKIASMSFRLFGNILGGGIIYMMIFDLLGGHKIFFLCYVWILVLLGLVFFKTRIRNRFPTFEKILKFFINIAFLMTWLQVIFGIFEGTIQAFVITMLTTTYLAIGVSHEEDAIMEDLV